MKKLLLSMIVVAVATPAWSQTKPAPAPKAVATRADPCAPIGQTANRELIYSMKCDHLPAPPPLPPQAEIQPMAAPEPETHRSGLFGMSVATPGAPSAQGRSQ